MQEVYVAKNSEEKKKQEEKKEEEGFGHSHSPFAAYYYHPHKIWFETQEKEEKIVLFLRQHPIVNIPWIAIAILLSIAPFFLIPSPFVSFLPQNFQFIAVLLWYLLVLAFILEGALSWIFNVYIVTDERIIDVDFYNLIHRDISDAKIDKIQDVSIRVGGVAGTIFNFGDVRIQTAGEIPNFEFKAVPNPNQVGRVLQELRTEEEIEALEGRVR